MGTSRSYRPIYLQEYEFDINFYTEKLYITFKINHYCKILFLAIDSKSFFQREQQLRRSNYNNGNTFHVFP